MGVGDGDGQEMDSSSAYKRASSDEDQFKKSKAIIRDNSEAEGQVVARPPEGTSTSKRDEQISSSSQASDLKDSSDAAVQSKSDADMESLFQPEAIIQVVIAKNKSR